MSGRFDESAFDDPKLRERFESELARMEADPEIIAWHKALEDSERITAEDLAITINAT